MHLVHIDGIIHGIRFRIYLTTGVLHTKTESIGNILYQLIQIEFLAFEDGFLAVKHRHLQYFFHKESQTFRLLYAVAQAAGSLTFACSKVPEGFVNINVLIL